MAPSRHSVSPSLAGASPYASSSESIGNADLDGQYPRERRRLSPDEDDLIDVPAAPTASRIKPRKSTPSSPHPGDLEKPAISNGKAVDASLSFATLGAAPWLIASLANMAITRPTGIQKGCIPKILESRDVIGGSKTGSGKTVAFTVPILQKWAEDPVGIFAVVLTPTRSVETDTRAGRRC